MASTFSITDPSEELVYVNTKELNQFIVVDGEVSCQNGTRGDKEVCMGYSIYPVPKRPSSPVKQSNTDAENKLKGMYVKITTNRQGVTVIRKTTAPTFEVKNSEINNNSGSVSAVSLPLNTSPTILAKLNMEPTVVLERRASTEKYLQASLSDISDNDTQAQFNDYEKDPRSKPSVGSYLSNIYKAVVNMRKPKPTETLQNAINSENYSSKNSRIIDTQRQIQFQNNEIKQFSAAKAESPVKHDELKSKPGLSCKKCVAHGDNSLQASPLKNNCDEQHQNWDVSRAETTCEACRSVHCGKAIKIPTCTVGVNTDYVFNDLVREEAERLIRLHNLSKKDIEIQVEVCEVFNDDFSLDGIFDNIEFTPTHQKMDEEHIPASLDFKSQLVFNLKACSEFDSSGNLPIHRAILENNLEAVSLYSTLMAVRRMHIDTFNRNFQTPLQLAVICKADKEIIAALINEFKADALAGDSFGNSLLHLSVLYSDPEMLEYILQLEICDHNAMNFDGITPLILSIYERDIEKAEILLRGNANPNVCDQKSGRTALFHAIEMNNFNMVSLLLEYKAHTKIKNFDGISPHNATFELDTIDKSIKNIILNTRNRMKRRRKAKISEAELANYTSKQAKFSPACDEVPLDS